MIFSRAVEAADIRHLQHEDLSVDHRRSCMSRFSGSVTASRTSCVRCVYTCVVRALLRPGHSWITLRLMPASSKRVAYE